MFKNRSCRSFQGRRAGRESRQHPTPSCCRGDGERRTPVSSSLETSSRNRPALGGGGVLSQFRGSQNPGAGPACRRRSQGCAEVGGNARLHGRRERSRGHRRFWAPGLVPAPVQSGRRARAEDPIRGSLRRGGGSGQRSAPLGAGGARAGDPCAGGNGSSVALSWGFRRLRLLFITRGRVPCTSLLCNMSRNTPLITPVMCLRGHVWTFLESGENGV